MRKVRYNGLQQSCDWCDSATNLIVGQEYTVIGEQDRDWQTNLQLKEVEGEYNSMWFDDIYPVNIGISHNLPQMGERYTCYKLVFAKGSLNPAVAHCITSPVTEVENIGYNVFQVTTKNSIYFIYVE